MTTQMYNVFSALKNHADGERTFIMTSPLGSLGMLLGVHRDALKRISAELDGGKQEATLHMNNSGSFPHLVFFVTKA